MEMVEKKTSKEILADSLSQLLLEKPFDRITVTEITSNCDISKRTFYYYFKDKYELALWLYIHQLDHYSDAAQGRVTFHGFLEYSANVLWKDRFLIQSILQYSGQNNFRLSVFTPMLERYLHLIEHIYGDTITEELRESVKFFLGGMIAYAEQALTDQCPPPEQSVALFESCIPPILKKYLNDPPEP